MQSIVANVENIRFDLEEQLDSQIGAQPLPFPGMDSKFTIFSPNSAVMQLTWIVN